MQGRSDENSRNYWLIGQLLFLLDEFLGYELLYEVIDVVDGDTIAVLDRDGERVKVRLIGIDAPDFADHKEWADASQLYVEELLLGESVRLEMDESQ